MRTPLATLTAALALAACSSGGRYVVVQPTPEPPPTPPLELTLARPVNGKLYVQTNRPAYVAIFEIVPERGVTLAHPSTPRQSRVTLSGMHRVPVQWSSPGGTYRTVGSKVTAKPQPTRYLYAVASDEPLAITEAAFQPGYLKKALGPAYRADDPYLTMRAISQEFVPSVPDEEWAEDLHVLAMEVPTAQPERLARVYCPDGTVYRVPEEIADDVWCPMLPRDGTPGAGQPRGGIGERRGPSRPDSVFGNNGRRVQTRARPNRGRGPADRVVVPSAEGGHKAQPAEEKESKVVSRPATPEPRGRGLDRREGGALRPIPAPRSDNGALKAEEKGARPAPAAGSKKVPPGRLDASTADRVKPTGRAEPVERPTIGARPETRDGKGAAPGAKPEGKPDGKSEGKSEGKGESKSKSEGKGEEKGAKGDDESKPEAKGESKPESKGEAKGEAESDDKPGKADEKSNGASDKGEKSDEKGEKSDDKPAQGKPKHGRPD